MAEFLVCIPSAGRAEKVGQYTLSLFPNATLVVPPREVGAYQQATGLEVLPQKGSGVSAARNTILDTFPGHDILMLDDDVRELGVFVGGEKRPWNTPGEQQKEIAKLFAFTRFKRGLVFSCAPVPNAFYFSSKKPISTNLFLIGTFTGYLAKCPVRYDETMPVKEDYDFTVRVWLACGIALRFNYVYCDAVHYTNRGGAVTTRNDDTEREAISILLGRWPKYIKLNPRRQNEVLLKLPVRRKV